MDLDRLVAMKDRSTKSVKPRAPARVRVRNPVARALIERALGGGRVVPSRKRYTRKLKHPKRDRPDD